MYYLTVSGIRSESVPKTMYVKDLAECLFVFYAKQIKTFHIILGIIIYNIHLFKMVFINRYIHFKKWLRIYLTWSSSVFLQILTTCKVSYHHIHINFSRGHLYHTHMHTHTHTNTQCIFLLAPSIFTQHRHSFLNTE